MCKKYTLVNNLALAVLKLLVILLIHWELVEFNKKLNLIKLFGGEFPAKCFA